MVRATETKVSALVYVVAILVLHLLPVPLDAVGVRAGCTLSARLLHPFFHASLLHCLVNGWALLSVVFIYEPSLVRLLVCYGIAVSFPASLFGCATPTVGASGVIFALLGSLSFSVRRRWYWQAWWAFFLGLGFVLPTTNGWVHLYCYVLGVAIGFLCKPVRR